MPTREEIPAHGVERATVDADLGGQHRVAHGLVFEFAEFLRQLGALPAVGFGLFGQRGQHVLLQRRDRVLALQLVAHREGLGQAITNGGLERLDDTSGRGRCGPRPLRLAGFGNEFIDGVDGDLHLLVAEHHRAEHDVFGQFHRFGFDHQHRVGGAGDDQLELGIDQLALGRVEQVLAVLVTDLGGTDRAIERGTRQRDRSRRAEQRQDVAIHFRVHRHHGGDDLHFIAEAIREQRADRAIDQARDQRFLLGLAAFALEEPTRDAAAGVELLLVVDGQREEVLAFARALVGHRADKHDGAFARDHHGAAGLARDLAGFKGDLVLAVLEGFADLRHCLESLVFFRLRAEPRSVRRTITRCWVRRHAALGWSGAAGIVSVPQKRRAIKKNRGALLRRGRVLGQRRRPSLAISAL